ncbi:MAG TPA: VCBS repeat-containing protein [Agriterribacter sp.]|nr:VCBS repeat-containing protein [Agriterribacter sp.]
MTIFYNERNIPVLLSREGPKADTADVNNDGLADIYVGGAANQPGQLYIQQPNGGFIKKREPLFDRFAMFEDTGVLFFDCDGDGDKDLFIGAGGNHRQQGMPELQHRLYINDGKGNFSIDSRRLPPNTMNISVVTAGDFDNDGDLDLFIGSRSVPFTYGISPQSYLLENDGKGNFTDVTKSKAPGLQHVGMVTGAVWADIDGDKRNELIICGEWMSPMVFAFTDNRFTEIPTSLSGLLGWWQNIAVADVNNDGKQDLILANIGENFYLRPSAEKPVKLWLNDFDHNGSIDKILTYSINGRDMPVFVKNEIQDQLPVIRRQNPDHEAYATKSIQELFPEELLRASTVKQFNFPFSCVAINQGNNRFTIQHLPQMVQLSCVNTICVTDINNDGAPDLVLGGNKFGFLPQFGRLDASFGHVLLNNKGVFQWVDPAKSGLLIEGEIKDILSFNKGKNKHFLFFRNNDFPVEYGMNNAATGIR